MKNSAHHHNAKNVIYFLAVLLAFSIFLLFNSNQEEIILYNFKPFMLLVSAGLALLLVLVYLVSVEHKPSKAPSRKKKRK